MSAIAARDFDTVVPDGFARLEGPRALRGRALACASDDRLSLLIAAGDREAFAIAYDRHFAALVRYCRGILLSREDAEDAAQAAMVEALRTLPDKPARINLRAWLYRVAHNEAIDLLRRRRAHDPLDSVDTDGTPGAACCADTADVVGTRERLAELVRDLRALPERQRGALVMREFCGLEYEEIATAIGGSEAAAMQTVFEARSALTACEEGRSLTCAGVQRLISDGDRRSMRARRIRAHMRSCDGCRAFETSATHRRRDFALLLLPPLAGKGGLAALLGLVRSQVHTAATRCAAATTRFQGAPAGVRGAAVGVLCVAAGGGVAAVAHHAAPHAPAVAPHAGPSVDRVAHTRPAATHVVADLRWVARHRHVAVRRARVVEHHRVVRVRATHLVAPDRASVAPASAPVAATGTAAPGSSSGASARPAAAVGVEVSAGSGHAGVHVAANIGKVASVTGEVSVGSSASGTGVNAAVAASTPVASANVSVGAGTQATPSGTKAGANVATNLCLLSCAQ